MDDPVPERSPSARPRDTLLRLIALFKLVKCGLLVFAGVAALELHQPGVARNFEQWATAIANHYHAPSVAAAIRTLCRLDHGRTTMLAAACFAYAALFLTEGIGLWRDRRWAEYLTIVATASLVPLELFELTRKITAVRIGALVVNLLIVVYLVGRLRRSRPGHERGLSSQ